MEKRIIAANWKMNTTKDSAIQLAKKIKSLLDENLLVNKEIIIAAPYLFIASLSEVFSDNSPVKLAVQNCFDKPSGAYTGEISAEMISSMNIEYCIVGHSERRQYFNESDEIIFSKIKLLLQNNVKPIFCCGETLEQRDRNIHFDTIKKQLSDSVLKLSKEELNQIIIAYEPVWAIGTGKTASPDQAQEMHSFISNTIHNHFNDSSLYVPLIYGGSCNTKNAESLFNLPNVNGGLIGGASLVAEDFVYICHLP